MFLFRLLPLTFLFFLCFSVAPLREAHAQVTPAAVRNSIKQAVRYIRSQEGGLSGTWSDTAQTRTAPGGVTALATLALLEAGVPVNDQLMKRALKNVRELRTPRTYVVALQVMVLCKAARSAVQVGAAKEQDRMQIQTLVNWLAKNQVKAGRGKGGWYYPRANSDHADESNTQFAVLALYEAAHLGIHPPNRDALWREALNFWTARQYPDGGWAYRDMQSEPTGSMTTAGTASLLVISRMLGQGDADFSQGRFNCCNRRADEIQQRINRGYAWLSRNFSISQNPNGGSAMWRFYYLYGLERVGRLSGKRFFVGTTRTKKEVNHDWYREGCDYLVRTQNLASGNWSLGASQSDILNDVTTTAFALLFLAKGRRPILMSKAQFGNEGDWNPHRNDAFFETRWLEPYWKRDMTTQVVKLEEATVDDLMLSPVLYLSGSRSPVTRENIDAVAKKLRGYLDRGGFILAVATKNGGPFDAGFRALMQKVAQDKDASLRLLEPGHPIYDVEFTTPQKHTKLLLGLDYGCRTSVVYLPPEKEGVPSLSCLWESLGNANFEKYPKPVRDQIETAAKQGANILAYATGRELLNKPPGTNVSTDKPLAGQKVERGAMKLAKLRHTGGCDSAPRAIAQLAKLAGENLKIPTAPKVPLINIRDDALFDHPLIFMHGRSQFQFTEQERKLLATYLNNGGTLFADAICGSKAFATSFRSEISQVLPKMELVKVPAKDPLYTKRFLGKTNLQSTSKKEPYRADDGTIKTRTVNAGPPTLEGIKHKGRWIVLFSPLDVSCALEKSGAIDCRGYSAQDAARIALTVIMYSIEGEVEEE